MKGRCRGEGGCHHGRYLYRFGASCLCDSSTGEALTRHEWRLVHRIVHTVVHGPGPLADAEGDMRTVEVFASATVIRSFCCSADQKLAPWALPSEGVSTDVGPVAAASLYGAALNHTARTYVAGDMFPGIELAFPGVEAKKSFSLVVLPR